MSQPSPTQRANYQVSKLRSSCDGCGAAKVKCDRQQPACNRCVGLGLACVYGPSRFSGKPPRKRVAVDSIGILPKRMCLPPQEVNCQLEASNLQLSNEDQTQIPSLTSSVPLGTGIDDWALLDDWLIGATGPAPEFVSSSTHAVNHSESSSHSCPRESYEIFRDLICPSPSLHAPESNADTVTARFDEVLTFNRSAIGRLSRLLDCPCAKSGHRAMVHSSILSRILIWYQQAAGWPTRSPSSSSSPPSPSETELQSEAPTSSTPSVQATGFAVDPVSITVGTFRVEDEMLQTTIRIQLVLSELKRVAEVIDTFRTSQDTDEDGPGLYSHLGGWLHGEHARTVRILKARLCTLN